jgi:hypothetical protein
MSLSTGLAGCWRNSRKVLECLSSTRLAPEIDEFAFNAAVDMLKDDSSFS